MNFEGNFDLRFTTIKHQFISNAHQLLNRKLCLFLNETHSLKQFIRVKKTKTQFLSVFLMNDFLVITYHIDSISVHCSIELF
jgi:hypothetical protein